MQKAEVNRSHTELATVADCATAEFDNDTEFRFDDELLEPPAKIGRWFQFSLRTLVVSLVCVTIVSGIFMINDGTAKQEAYIVNELSAFRADVYFDYEYRDGKFSPNPTPPGPGWLREFLGENYFARISYIQLPHGCSQTAFENVTKLKALESIDIFNAKRIKNLDSIRDLWKLERLSLNDCGSITDLAPIGPLHRLEELSLPGCKSLNNLDVLISKKLKTLDVTASSLTNVDFLQGMETLEELYLENSKQLLDIDVLGDLQNLSKLDLRGCDQITFEMVKQLKAKLTTTNIVSDF